MASCPGNKGIGLALWLPLEALRLEEESDAGMRQGQGVKDSAQSSTVVLLLITIAREVSAQHHRLTTMLCSENRLSTSTGFLTIAFLGASQISTY